VLKAKATKKRAKAAAKAKPNGKRKSNGKLDAEPAAAIIQAPARPADPFNLDALALPQDFNTSGVKKAITAISVRKPNRQEFIRCHPSLRGNVAVIEDRVEREEYLVADLNRTGFINELAQALPGEVISKTLYFVVTRQGTPLLWPVRLPDPDGRDRGRDWSRSARDAAEMAIGMWLRCRLI
jgi:hypothetical protein